RILEARFVCFWCFVEPEAVQETPSKVQLFGFTAENMEQIADNSIDVVVVTLMLCSVPDIDTILREILRVLASGGKYYFIEHIAEFDLQKHGLRRKLQDVGHWLGFWSFLFDGCHMNRDILTNIERAGFSSVDAQKFYNKTWFIFSLTSPSLKGIATK
ncbi:Methyltransferase-like protein 7A-like 3, partial [Homarus americanus]